MHLYRAQADKPEFPLPELEEELRGLELERDSGPANEYMVDAFKRMGKEKYVRLIELRQIVRDKRFFTLSEYVAKTTSSSPGNLISMEVPDEEATPHKVSPEEVGATGEKVLPNMDYYSFDGGEITKNRDAWHLTITRY